MSEIARREIAQLLIPVIRWQPEGGFRDARPLIDEALALGVGGFYLEGGDQDLVRALAKELQHRSAHPLLIGAAFERGAGQRVRGATGLPPLAAIVALNDLESLRRAARLTAREARTMGVNWNLAPVCDLDLFAENPILGARSFGRDGPAVAKLAAAWVEACQAEGVLACARHFPGLGRVTTDPHVAGASVDAPADQLKELDLQPFRSSIAAGVASIMTGHVAYPALDPSRMPATLSRELVQWLLRQQLKFENLIVSDALTMPGVLEGRDPADAAVLALRAGCDLLLDPGPLGEALDALDAAQANGLLDPDRLRLSYRRRLKWAQWAAPPNDWRRPSGADLAWGALLADRTVQIVHGPIPPAGMITEVAIVDDDTDVSGYAIERTAVVEGMRLSGNDARVVEAPTPASGSALVIALFADYLPTKQRAQLRPETVTRVHRLIEQAEALRRPVVLAAFGDPRFVQQLAITQPTLVGWNGDRVMQQAVGRVLLRKPK